MKTIALFSVFFFSVLSNGWLTNFKDARQVAVANNKLILVNFSGSDWCGPCIRTKKEIFETDDFKIFADTNLVLVNADFPRSSKNKLSKEQVKLNEALADVYNAKGIFPLTILMTADGKVLKEWEGFPEMKPAAFVEEIKKYSNGNN